MDRRRMRLIQALLAFPAAGLMGLAGTTLARTMLDDRAAVTAPAPAPRDETPAGDERDEPAPDEDARRPRLA